MVTVSPSGTVPSVVLVPVVLPLVSGVVEPDVVDPDAVPRVRPRGLDALCGSFVLVEPAALVGGYVRSIVPFGRSRLMPPVVVRPFVFLPLVVPPPVVCASVALGIIKAAAAIIFRIRIVLSCFARK